LDGVFKHSPVPPDIHDTLDLSLNLTGGTFISNRDALGHEGRKGLDEVHLLPDFGLLRQLCRHPNVREHAANEEAIL